jgi:hypothetical protein
LDAGRRVYIETATVVQGSPIADSNYVRVWQGFVDSVDPQAETIELTCRDESSVLIDRMIEVQREYGSTSGTAITTVLQKILDDNLGAGVVTLAVQGSPVFLLLPWNQDKEPIFSAMLKLVEQIGWDLRYKWNDTAGNFRLTLWTPDRSNTNNPAFTFTHHDFTDIKQLRISREDVRNVIVVTYTDAATQIRQTVSLTDSASITRYGRRYMEIQEASASQIDTSLEATTMATAALSDLKEPMAEQVMVTDYFWPAQLGDLYAFGPNNVLYDSTQYFAVISISHRLEEGSYQSEIITRGRPATAYRRWIGMDARPGVGGSINMADPTAPQNVALTQIPMGFTLAHDLPKDPTAWGRTEVYVSTTQSGVTQTQQNGKNSKPTGQRVSSARATAHTVNNLLTNAENTKLYYVGAVLVDTDNNYGTLSPVLPVYASRIGAAFENTAGAVASLLRNTDFNIYSRGTENPPDFWSPGGPYFPGAWVNPTINTLSAGAWFASGGSGNYSVQLYRGGAIQSEIFPFAENDIISLACTYKLSGTPNINSATDGLHVTYYYAMADGTPDINNPQAPFILDVTASRFVDTGGEWITGLDHAHISPAGTRYARVSLKAPSNVTVFVDRIGATRGKPFLNSRCRYAANEFQTDVDTPMTVVPYPDTVGFNVLGDKTMAKLAGKYRAHLSVTLYSTNTFQAGDDAEVWVETSTTGGVNTWYPNQFGRQKTTTNDNGETTISITTGSFYLGAGHYVRPAINPTETFEIHQPREQYSVFTVECVSRGDS